MSDDTMLSDRMNMWCTKCKWLWVEHLDLPMTVTAFVARMRGTLCPKCSCKKINWMSDKAVAEARAILTATPKVGE